jgi:hypothetical protein
MIGALARLVRAPAALTVLGDSVAGAAMVGKPLSGKRLALPLSSVAFYWAGMALNDWADRKVDAVERPERPIPSGQVRPATALAVAAGLTASGLGLAAVGGGRDAVRVAVPLAASVWAYDIALKSTVVGPLSMAVCRGLDVLLGSGVSGMRAAWRPAVAIATHTFGVTALSRGEVHGGDRAVSRMVLAGTALAVTATMVTGRGCPWWRRAGSAAFGATFGAEVGAAQLAAARAPTAAMVRAATVAGIHGMIPLQAAFAARHGRWCGAALIGSLYPIARRLARRVSPT